MAATLAVVVFEIFFFAPFRAWNGIHPDDAMLLLPMLGLITQHPSLLWRYVTASIAGIQIPVAIHDHHGPWDAYLSLPFLLLWGNTARADIFRNAFFGGFDVLAVFVLARRLYRNVAPAFAAALLWGTFASFVVFARTGLFTASSIVGMGLLALADFVKWHDESDSRALVKGFAWLGLGLWTRTWFAGMILVDAFLAVVFHRDILKTIRRDRWRGWRLPAACAGAFGVWALPTLVSQAINGWEMFKPVINAVFSSPAYATKISLFQKLRLDAEILTATLEGRIADFSPWYFLGLHSPPERLWPQATAMILLASAAGTLLAALGSLRRKDSIKRSSLATAVFTGYAGLAFISPVIFLPDYWLPALPFLFISAAALPWQTSNRRWRPFLAGLLALFCGLWMFQNGRLLAWAGDRIAATGGVGVETSGALRDLTAWLLKRGISRPLVASRGDLTWNLEYWSAGDIDPDDYRWGGESFPRDSKETRAVLRRGRGRYLVAWVDRPEMDIRSSLRDLARSAGRHLELVAQFFRKDGAAIFEVYRID